MSLYLFSASAIAGRSVPFVVFLNRCRTYTSSSFFDTRTHRKAGFPFIFSSITPGPIELRGLTFEKGLDPLLIACKSKAKRCWIFFGRLLNSRSAAFDKMISFISSISTLLSL